MVSVKTVNIALIGFGNVGRALVKTIVAKKRYFVERYGVALSIVAVTDSMGAVVKPEGFDDQELLKMCELPRSGLRLFRPYSIEGAGVEEVYEKTVPDIHIELTPSDYRTGEPGYSNILYAIRRGAHVVTANKAPLALYFDRVMGEARSRGLLVRFRATVMGGTPFLDTLINMRSHVVERIEGVINTTTNYILTEMQESLVDLDQALRKAQALGIAERDPRLDIEGLDAAAKLVIVSHVVGRPIEMDRVYRESLTSVSLRDVIEASRQGRVVKYIASLDTRSGTASVKIERVPRDSFFAQVRGRLNGVRVKTDVTELFFIGLGGGGVETAHSVLDDTLYIALHTVGETRQPRPLEEASL